MPTSHSRWVRQLLGCVRKGREAYRAGIYKDECPYKGHSNVQSQRRGYWLHGWETAMAEDKAKGTIQ